GVAIRYGQRQGLDRLAGPGHQGAVARLAVRGDLAEEDALRGQPGERFLFVLDEVQDPHHLGAVIRVAEAIGARGVVPGRGGGRRGRSPWLGARQGRASGSRSLGSRISGGSWVIVRIKDFASSAWTPAVRTISISTFGGTWPSSWEPKARESAGWSGRAATS